MSTLFGESGPTFASLSAAVRRVVQEPDSFIEIQFSVLTVRVYPSRLLPLDNDDDVWAEKERLKQLTIFMMTLSQEVGTLPTRFAFELDDEGDLSIGLIHLGGEVWMPCEIVSLDRSKDGEPATARFSFLDQQGEPIVVEFRRIRL